MTAALVLLALIPLREPVIDDCDVIELNHFYDADGKHVFNQYVFYRFDYESGDYRVIDWRMADKGRPETPRWNPRSKRWELSFGDDRARRLVRATSFRVTATQHDPEVADRAYLPKERRPGLTPPPLSLRRR